jgi:threonine 3-dehydrogenase
VIGIEPDPKNAELARRLGADVVLTPGRPPADAPWKSDPAIRDQILALTDGVGVDVAMEMAGHNSSTNNAIRNVRRGGDVVLFGVKNGDAVFEDAHRIVMNGLNLHGIVGRRLFQTWATTKSLLEDDTNGIQDAIWDVILNRGDGSLVDLDQWTKDGFQTVLDRFTKPVIRVAG